MSTVTSWLSGFYATCKVLLAAWIYRKPIIAVMGDVGTLEKLYAQLVVCDDAKKARTIVQSILNLPSIEAVVLATPTKIDDLWLPRIKMCVSDMLVFDLAWRILRGEWNIKVQPDRQRRFLSGIRSILPFARIDTRAETATIDVEVLSDREAEGIVEVVSLISLLLQVIPKIVALFKK